MKRLFALVLIVLLLAGCAPQQEIPEPTAPEVTDPPVIQTDPTEPPTEPEIPTLVLDVEEVLFRDYGDTCALYTGEIDMAEITWTSADEAIATVDGGVVTAVARGETVITAQFADQSVSCNIVCNLPILPVLNPDAGERDPVYLPPEVEIVDGSFFDDAVFVGDSQALILYNCATYYDLLGDTTYLARNSYSVDSAANNKMLMSYQGQKLPLEDAIAATGAKRAFIMLGINDVAYYSASNLEPIMENWANLIARIREKCPDLQICLQSTPPVWTGGETARINNEVVSAYNAQLKIFAEENDCVFIDVAAYLMDSTGGMATVYCSDYYVHVNPAGVDTWVKVLKACTEYE